MTQAQKSNLNQECPIISNISDLGLAKLTISNDRFDLYPYSKDTYILITYKAALSNKINELLDYPYEDYRMTKDDEPMFRFEASRLKGLSKALRLKL